MIRHVMERFMKSDMKTIMNVIWKLMKRFMGFYGMWWPVMKRFTTFRWNVMKKNIHENCMNEPHKRFIHSSVHHYPNQSITALQDCHTHVYLALWIDNSTLFVSAMTQVRARLPSSLNSTPPTLQEGEPTIQHGASDCTTNAWRFRRGVHATRRWIQMASSLLPSACVFLLKCQVYKQNHGLPWIAIKHFDIVSWDLSWRSMNDETSWKLSSRHMTQMCHDIPWRMKAHEKFRSRVMKRFI